MYQQPQQQQQYQPQQPNPYAQQPNPYAQQQSGFPQQTPYNPYEAGSRAHQQPTGPTPQSQIPQMDPFGSIATSMLQQSGSNYLERGQEFVKSRMLINSSSLHYHFDVDNEYGGHPFKSPRQDVNAPDLYIPVTALFTYCILGSITMVAKGKWTTDSMYALVSSGLTAWTAHLLLLKLVLWLLGVPSAVPLLEAACYTGYPLVLVCINTVIVALLGGWSFYAAWVYGSLCMATFIVRTMKRVLFREARQYSRCPVASNRPVTENHVASQQLSAFV